jgi:hypothetical protein
VKNLQPTLLIAPFEVRVQLKVSIGDLRQVIFRRDFKLRGAGDAFPCTPQFERRKIPAYSFPVFAFQFLLFVCFPNSRDTSYFSFPLTLHSRRAP